ncbi:MAG TPA: CapA family protein [Gemmataceae bacterium]|nr:CapA family protein [Gemmataceae bacterium]
MQANGSKPICIFLCGDVMTGRGIDQLLPHPGNPTLHEPCVLDARFYVELAERVSGPIVRPLDPAYIWGDALDELQRANVRIVNLETSITTSDRFWRGKEIHYRMHPRNVECLKVAHVDCCCLANNHVLDWGRAGLLETLETLDGAGLPHAGAGRDLAEAVVPVILPMAPGRRVLIFAFGSTSSGIPADWAATSDRSGVNLLDGLCDETARRIGELIAQHKRMDDLVIVSIHWGGNWGYDVTDREIRFAHRLIDDGVDVVHGHSSHHVKAIEIYRDRPIFYGCGDFIDDYEGINAHESFRADLRLMYFVAMDPQSRKLIELRLVPLRSTKLRLTRVLRPDAEWLHDLLNRLGNRFSTHLQLMNDSSLALKR